ncbi:MAG TPA: four helix bundle protein [Chitinophagales bacterium]|nr:four helix bundle protein [Chitinophagales bacterium]HMW13349.1 four helix bundle protein [Chitinophagales bacterium]HMX61039.1 four helix bundle protein [Chitinophagales bacterium]HMY23944.1 four helix bundle protein [Chitinophagales bacterium]HMZ34291.1 four helix bundle protein [Chitinophagales bacterium]
MDKTTKITSYKDLIVWQKSIDFVSYIYGITSQFPSAEKFNLTSQINRAVISIPVNIAEGFGRESSKNYIQFLKISRGSLYEVDTLFIISKNLEYITTEVYSQTTLFINEISKLLNGLIKSIQNKIIN